MFFTTRGQGCPRSTKNAGRWFPPGIFETNLANHARRSLMLARISATTSAFGFAPCGPPWCRRRLTAPASMSRPPMTSFVLGLIRFDGPLGGDALELKRP